MLFRREIKRNYKSFLIVTGVCLFFEIYIIAMAPSFGPDIKQILDLKLPGGMQKAFGMEGLDFNDPLGFLGIGFSYVYLFLSIAFASVFATIVSKEFSEKTAEYLFSLPAKRVHLIRTKLALAFLYILLSVVAVFLGCIIGLITIIGGEIDFVPVVLMAVSWFLGGIALGSIAFLLSAYFTRSRTASAISIGLVMGMYLLQIVISMNGDLDFLIYISPFDWFKGADIVREKEISLVYSLIAAGVSALCLFFGIRRYKRMDVLI